MSKKHKKFNGQSMGQVSPGSQSSSLSHAAEYRVIKFDLVKVLVLNVIYFAAILALYYGNQHSHFVDNWFAKLLHF